MTLIIPFPSRMRTGHARKVATQLAKARSNREADHILSRAIRSYVLQMQSIGIVDQEIKRQRIEFLTTIHLECQTVGAGWLPNISSLDLGESGGAA
ncbi:MULTISPECIES: DUF6074 family protein [unclassified Ensifer]|uniref:DUF6074 family protein n=1 Tax=unclassified Ensifer TaxID=2633371 RepID=UPI00070C03EB|nr:MULTISPECIES: DUF6074 family protein [unclassified Ensifer]KQW62715.1 hypothetical protein ASD02_00860 [Ensifer sp. Root1252]KRC83535.1 hypothetical protein ASE32_00855 [Ensifer sp. Root231]KRC86560.1 hypothetical protein ASE47_16795 [Ensifer sp. Root258]